MAAGFNKLGANVSAVVGTRTSTVNEAILALETNYGIRCTGYTDLHQALETEKPDIVALCSPHRFHIEQLAAIAEANCHCLVEKPLAWPGDDRETRNVVDAFERRGLLLQMVAQWPQTLAGFVEIHGAIPQTVQQFQMGLSPISLGGHMIPDAAPHFISMLQALNGTGTFDDIVINQTNTDPLSPNRMVLECNYRHRGGSTQAQLVLETCETRPRPAWYQINQCRVDRKVELPEYRQRLVGNDTWATLRDPIESVVEDFLQSLVKREATDMERLRQGQHNLRQLAQAWQDSAAD